MLMLMSVLVMIMIVRTAVMHDCYDAAIRPDVKLKHLVLMVLGGGVVATPKKANDDGNGDGHGAGDYDGNAEKCEGGHNGDHNRYRGHQRDRNHDHGDGDGHTRAWPRDRRPKYNAGSVALVCWNHRCCINRAPLHCLYGDWRLRHAAGSSVLGN